MQKGGVILAGTVSVLLKYVILTVTVSVSSHPSLFQQGAQVFSMAVVLFWLTAGVPRVAWRAGFAQEPAPPDAGDE